MNKIFNVNIGGHAVTIDDDAYEYLKAYLENIRRRFKESDGRDEIMRDVEDRLGELVTQFKGNNVIVMLPHVESAIEIMGKPEDFGGEPTSEGEQGESTTTGSSASAGTGGMTFGQHVKTGKRLFRDENDAVISGVCSGLSAYFGLSEPLWMRLIFVLLAIISAGFWVPVYILLMIIVPPAKSATERLEMKGEPINVDSIAKEFQQGYDRLSDHVSNGGGKRFARNSASVSGGCLYLMSRLGIGVLILIAASLVLGLGSAWVASMFAFFTAEPYINYFSPLSAGWNYLGVFSLFMLLGLPVVALCLWLAKTIFKFNAPAWLNTTLSVSWIASAVTAFAIVSFAGRSLRTGATINKTVDMTAHTSDTLRVRWADFNKEDLHDNVRWSWPWADEVFVKDEQLVLREFVRIRVRKSNSDKFEARLDIRARGGNNQEAIEHANAMNFQPYILDNELFVPHRIKFDQTGKWWVRQMTIYIGVPEGKYIVFDDNIYNYAAAEYDDYAPGNDENYISKTPGMFYKMTPEGINCATCPNIGDANYRSDRSYEKFIFEGNMEVEMRQDDDFSIRIEGDKSVLETIRSGDKLTMISKSTGQPVKVIITTNTLTSLNADDTGLISVRGFDEGWATLSAKGKSRIKAYVDCSSHLETNLTGESSIILSGRGGNLRASLSDNSSLDATDWRADDVEISANGTSKAKVYARDNAKVRTTENADVKVEGNADIEKN
jgi:phage shock protein PspC (stress-responsive transcriptional regulator)